MATAKSKAEVEKSGKKLMPDLKKS